MSDSWTPAKSDLDKGLRGLHLDDVASETVATSSRCSPADFQEEPLVTPIYHSTTYKIPSIEHYLKILDNGGNIYVRLGNPTCQAAEATLSDLEGGAGAMVFTSGMAAISTVLLTFLKSGDHVIACQPLYSGTHKFLDTYLSRYNVEVSWTSIDSGVDGYRKLMKPNTKMLYGETPCNPFTTILDLEAFGQLGHSVDGVLTVIDSTYGTPCIQRPHQFGIDIVIHSGTKYISGHSDVLAGVVSTRTVELWQELNVCRTTIGTVLSPHDAALLLRGVRTLPLRMDRHCSNAQKVAEFLATQPEVSKVHYPGLASDKGHELAKKQMKMFGGMLAFEMKGGFEAAKTVLESVRLIQFAVSLGGVESLIEHPASMTHGPMIMSNEDREKSSISPGLIRLSVGLENVDDIIKDLKQALAKIKP